jgi:dTDP-4-amino-4,6-dideoxygalactose transaminase
MVAEDFFEMKFSIIKPYITKKEEQQIIDVLKSGWLTQGRYVKAVEEKVKKYTKVKHAFLLNSATSGLVIAVKALGLKAKDEVICPSFTFPATSNAVILAGAKPVFCDIDLDTFNISVEQIEKVITKNTKAVMPVSEFGLPSDMHDICKISKRYHLHVIEDAACALGSKIKDKKIGSFGDMGIFSFHPRKIITSGEGGCLVTNSADIAKRTEYLRNHGDYDKRFVGCGYNFRMSDIQASVLSTQFERIENVIKRRIVLAHNYNRLLRPLEDTGVLKIPHCPVGSRHTYQSYVILLNRRVNRDRVKAILRQRGIETQFGTHCVPLLDYYKNNFRIPEESYKNAYLAYRHTLTLPLYHTLNAKGQEFIADNLKKAVLQI